MMTYNLGDILLIKFPFTDSSRMSKRPALVLSPVWNRAKITVLNEATCFKRRTSASRYRRTAKTPT